MQVPKCAEPDEPPWPERCPDAHQSVTSVKGATGTSGTQVNVSTSTDSNNVPGLTTIALQGGPQPLLALHGKSQFLLIDPGHYWTNRSNSLREWPGRVPPASPPPLQPLRRLTLPLTATCAAPPLPSDSGSVSQPLSQPAPSTPAQSQDSPKHTWH